MMQIPGMTTYWKCRKCPSVIIIPLDVIRDEKGSLTVAKPPSCLKEQEGCGRDLCATWFDLIKIEGGA